MLYSKSKDSSCLGRLDLTDTDDFKERLEKLETALNPRDVKLTEKDAKALCKAVGIRVMPFVGSAKTRLRSLVADFKTMSVRSHIFDPEKSSIPASNLASRSIENHRNTVGALIMAVDSLTTDPKNDALTGNTKSATDAMNVLMCKIDSGSISSKDANTLLKDIAKRTDFDSDKTEFGSRRFKLGSNSENRKDLLMHLGFSDKDATKLSKNLRTGTLKSIVANFQEDAKDAIVAEKAYEALPTATTPRDEASEATPTTLEEPSARTESINYAEYTLPSKASFDGMIARDNSRNGHTNSFYMRSGVRDHKAHMYNLKLIDTLDLVGETRGKKMPKLPGSQDKLELEVFEKLLSSVPKESRDHYREAFAEAKASGKPISTVTLDHMALEAKIKVMGSKATPAMRKAISDAKSWGKPVDGEMLAIIRVEFDLRNS